MILSSAVSAFINVLKELQTVWMKFVRLSSPFYAQFLPDPGPGQPLCLLKDCPVRDMISLVFILRRKKEQSLRSAGVRSWNLSSNRS